MCSKLQVQCRWDVELLTRQHLAYRAYSLADCRCQRSTIFIYFFNVGVLSSVCHAKYDSRPYVRSYIKIRVLQPIILSPKIQQATYNTSGRILTLRIPQAIIYKAAQKHFHHGKWYQSITTCLPIPFTVIELHYTPTSLPPSMNE